MTKTALRQYYRQIRDEYVARLSAAERNDAAKAALAPVSALIGADMMVAAYVGFGTELDPLPVLKDWSESDIPILLPYFEGRSDVMTLCSWDGALEPGPFEIMQPPAGQSGGEPDIVVVPLIAIDLHGNRLGQGRGHYDRYLADLAAKRQVKTIGLAWDCQIAVTLPSDVWDRPLDYIATPTRLLETSK